MSRAPSPVVGTGICPACLKPGARWSLMKTGRVCITHDKCCQLMSRGDDSDELLRERRAPGGDLHDPAAHEAPTEPPPRVIHPPAPPADPPPAPPAAPRKPGWGVLSW